MGELALVGDHNTVPLTRVSYNTVFSKSQNARKAGTLCSVKGKWCLARYPLSRQAELLDTLLDKENEGPRTFWTHGKSWNSSIYNILRSFGGSFVQASHRPSVWCSKHFFFIISYRLRALKTLYFYFCNFIKKWENKLKGFCKKSWKKNAWNIRRLVDDSFVPSFKQPSISYCKLTHFW